jgi:hypothetical protein
MFISSISETTIIIRIKFYINDSILKDFANIIIVSISLLYTATGYGVDAQGVRVRVSVGARVFSSLRCPGLFWIPPTLLADGYRGYNAWVMKPMNHLQLVLRSRIGGSIHPLPHTSSWRNALSVRNRNNFTFIGPLKPLLYLKLKSNFTDFLIHNLSHKKIGI